MKVRMYVPLFVITASLLLALFNNNTKTYTEQYITGFIVDKTDSNFTIMNDNDTIYHINQNISSNKGSYVQIIYDGDLDYLKEEQNITVKSVSNMKNPYDNNIMNYVNSLTIEQKIGQLIMAKVPSKNKISTIENYHISGYIFYGEDIGNKIKEQIRDEIDNYQSVSDIPLLMAIDEEGGTVSRISGNKKLTKESFTSPAKLFSKGGFEAIYDDAIRKRDLLVELGFNVNYAPVIDVVTNKNAYMYNRSLGQDAEQTSLFAKTILLTQTEDMTYTFKHFPGYGNNKDTHVMKSIDNRSFESFDTNDFIPYRTAIENGAKQIMISHNIVKDIDNQPSSLSLIMHNILREHLGYTKVIITDSLSMDAITKNVSNPYVKAVLSGNNLIITEQPQKTFNDIYNAYEEGIITEELINRLVYRVIELKIDKGLINI